MIIAHDVNEYKTEAERLLAANQPRQAAALLGRALRVNNRDAEAYALMGIALGMSGDGAMAIQKLERSTTLEPWQDAYWCNLGYAYERAGAASQARDAYGRALLVNLRNERAQSALLRLQVNLLSVPLPMASEPTAKLDGMAAPLLESRSDPAPVVESEIMSASALAEESVSAPVGHLELVSADALESKSNLVPTGTLAAMPALALVEKPDAASVAEPESVFLPAEPPEQVPVPAHVPDSSETSSRSPQDSKLLDGVGAAKPAPDPQFDNIMFQLGCVRFQAGHETMEGPSQISQALGAFDEHDEAGKGDLLVKADPADTRVLTLEQLPGLGGHWWQSEERKVPPQPGEPEKTFCEKSGSPPTASGDLVPSPGAKASDPADELVFDPSLVREYVPTGKRSACQGWLAGYTPDLEGPSAVIGRPVESLQKGRLPSSMVDIGSVPGPSWRGSKLGPSVQSDAGAADGEMSWPDMLSMASTSSRRESSAGGNSLPRWFVVTMLFFFIFGIWLLLFLIHLV